MRRAVAGIKVTGALAALLTGASAAHAQIPIRIDDAQVVEQSSGDWTTPPIVKVRLPGPAPSPITVDWATKPGSASDGVPHDFLADSGQVVFNIGESEKLLSVRINGDTLNEWSSIQQQYEVFFIDLSNPSPGALIERSRSTITILDDDTPQLPGVRFFSILTDSINGNEGRNRLQWQVPAPLPPQIIVRFNAGSTPCAQPASDTAGMGGAILVPTASGDMMSWTHDSVNGPTPVSLNTYYCYSVFTRFGSLSPERSDVDIKTFDLPTVTQGHVRWAYKPGHYNGAAAPSVEPPTVGQHGIYAISSDGVVHAMARGLTGGGLRPPLWKPLSLGKAAHNRSAVVPFANRWLLFVGTENGEVHAVDAESGAIVWSRSQAFNGSQLMTSSAGAQAAPAGLFTAWGGGNNLLLVGTATGSGNTKFFALDPATGGTIDEYPNGGDPPLGPIDNVYGMAVVDYSIPNRAYFGTAGTSFTLWSLDLGAPGSPDLTASSLAWAPKPLGVNSGIQGSPVLRGTQLYLATDSDPNAAVQSLRITDGFLYPPYLTNDGRVKGFPWPDRRGNGQLYFSTTNKVHAIRDDGSSFQPSWEKPQNSPSLLLQRPGTDEIYLGDGLGRLVRLDAASGSEMSAVMLENGVQIHGPSLDNVHNLLIVGSDKGVIYAVRVGF
jgi:outer membrane protein assembly factor BamB